MNSIVSFIGIVALGASAASAEPLIITAPAPSARVPYADVNLRSDEGRAQLQQRIRGAAGILCLEDNIDSLKVRLQRKSCFTVAVADGYRQLDELFAARPSSTVAAGR